MLIPVFGILFSNVLSWLWLNGEVEFEPHSADGWRERGDGLDAGTHISASGEAPFHLLNSQVHGERVSPTSSARRSPIDPLTATGRGIKGQVLAMSLPCLCSLCWSGPRPETGRCPRTLFQFAPESICRYFWAVTAFPNICTGVSAWLCWWLGLCLPPAAAVQS